MSLLQLFRCLTSFSSTLFISLSLSYPFPLRIPLFKRVCLSVCMFVYLSNCICVWMYVCKCLFHLYIYFFVLSLSLYLSIYLSISISLSSLRHLHVNIISFLAITCPLARRAAPTFANFTHNSSFIIPYAVSIIQVPFFLFYLFIINSLRHLQFFLCMFVLQHLYIYIFLVAVV